MLLQQEVDGDKSAEQLDVDGKRVGDTMTAVLLQAVDGMQQLLLGKGSEREDDVKGDAKTVVLLQGVDDAEVVKTEDAGRDETCNQQSLGNTLC